MKPSYAEDAGGLLSQERKDYTPRLQRGENALLNCRGLQATHRLGR
jgi:hypothetical protein